MPKVMKYPVNLVNARQQYEFFDDFLWDQTDLIWIDTVTDLGTALVGDAVNGVMVLTPSDGTVADNDEVYLGTANATFLFNDDEPFTGGARVKFTETASGVYNCFVGFVNALNGADTMLDNGGGMKVSGSTAAIYKIDGSTVWKCVSANNGTSTVSTSSTSSTSTDYQLLEVEIAPLDGTQVSALFRVNGMYLRDSTTGDIIRHTIAVASAAQMNFGMGAKLGAITNNDTLNVDYAYYSATRQ